MAKPEKKIEPLSSFRRFEDLTRRLLAVPRKELQAKLDKYNQKKGKKPRRARKR
jgi:hypothetical protein